MNDNIIYNSHNWRVIDESLNTFRDALHDGSSAVQLLSGLAALDYLCYASELSIWQQERRESLELEARIRIDLDRDNKSNLCIDDLLKDLLYQIKNLFNTRIINNTSSLEQITDYLKAKRSIHETN